MHPLVPRESCSRSADLITGFRSSKTPSRMDSPKPWNRVSLLDYHFVASNAGQPPGRCDPNLAIARHRALMGNIDSEDAKRPSRTDEMLDAVGRF